MMKDRALSRLPHAANNDGEFTLAARLWDGDIVLVCDDDAVRLALKAGRMESAAAASKDAPAQIRIVASADGWSKMLQPQPPPFYHDLMGAQIHHGVRLQGAIEDVGPYYPALRRLIELLRAD